jgi:NAD(P)-dependent dehydrogenase (short-subunit alcohol dehydrogenase family)
MSPQGGDVAFSDDLLRLDGRVAVVTGAARGIGEATASLFARYGASLVLCDRVPTATFPTGDGIENRIERIVDVRDGETVDALVDEAVERFGRVDILVNNAGGTFAAPVLDVSDKGEAMLVAENFTHVTRLVRRVVPVMPAGGSIVNVTSIEAHQASPGFGIYAAMKAAVDSLTRTLALELAPRAIRVNAVAPDAIASGGEATARQELIDSAVPYEPVLVPPLGHLGTPDDAAGAALYLVTELARFVTGDTIHVDGGNWAAGGWRRTELEQH